MNTFESRWLEHHCQKGLALQILNTIHVLASWLECLPFLRLLQLLVLWQSHVPEGVSVQRIFD